MARTPRERISGIRADTPYFHHCSWAPGRSKSVRKTVGFLSWSPGELRPDREVRDIEARIRRAPNGRTFESSRFGPSKTTDITEALLRHIPQIVHFAGHREEGTGIYLEDDLGRSVAVSATTMRKLFEPLRGTTRLVA